MPREVIPGSAQQVPYFVHTFAATLCLHAMVLLTEVIYTPQLFVIIHAYLRARFQTGIFIRQYYL